MSARSAERTRWRRWRMGREEPVGKIETDERPLKAQVVVLS